MLKNIIKQELLNKNNKINSRKIKQHVDNNSKLLIDIIEETNFLQKDSSINERIYVILNDIHEQLLCPFCSSKRSFVDYRGYRNTCGKNTCSNKFRYSIEENRQKTGKSTKNNIEKNKQYFKKSLNDLEKYKQFTIFAPIVSFSSKKHVDNLLAIIAKSKNILPFNINKFDIKKEIYLRYEIAKTKNLPKCKCCGTKHTEIDYNTFKVKELCKQCETTLKQNYYLSNIKNKLEKEIEDFKILKIDGPLTKNVVTLQCKNNHTFERWLHGGRRTKIICPECNPYGSSFENEIVEFIKQNSPNSEIIRNSKKIIYPLELDIYLPQEKLAIEFNGDYWHSFNTHESIEQKMYHQHKFLQCKDKNINLIQIFEHEFFNKKDLILKKILNLLGKDNKIFAARKCIVYEIDKNIANIFLENNHIQGGTNQSSYHCGLFSNNELVAVMAFGKPRFNKKYEWEILRFATSCSVIGGASKLFKFFISNKSPKNVVTYSDNRFGTGNIYKKLGFSFSQITTPNYWYIKDGKILSRYKCQKHKLQKLFSDVDMTMSEEEIMFSAGYRRIWDAGTSKYELFF
jgi:hypothetical protein